MCVCVCACVCRCVTMGVQRIDSPFDEVLRGVWAGAARVLASDTASPRAVALALDAVRYLLRSGACATRGARRLVFLLSL